ncbi:hypothetical protein N8134_01990 [Flavobacteriales bacterium]|nr:hypothetical protein [Flavobacteriales bacterium]
MRHLLLLFVACLLAPSLWAQQKGLFIKSGTTLSLDQLGDSDSFSDIVVVQGDVIIEGTLALPASANDAVEYQGGMDINGSGSVTGLKSFHFSGTATGQSVSDLTASRLRITKTDGTWSPNNVHVEPTGSVWLENSVAIAVGENGSMTMNSDATGTAFIGSLGGSVTAGGITFERYCPPYAGGPSWLSVGNWVKDVTVADWENDMTGLYLIFEFDETHAVDNTAASNGANAWSLVSGSTALEDSDHGYVIYQPALAAPTLTATGGFNNIAETVSLSLSTGPTQGGGWHLLTNPFPCAIDGAEFVADNATISAYQMYNNANSLFTISSGEGSLKSPEAVDVGQSFWVQVSSANDVVFNTDILTNGVNSFLREIDLLDQGGFTVKVTNESGGFGATGVRFHELGTTAFEMELDAIFKPSGSADVPQLHSVSGDGVALVVNSTGSVSSSASMPLELYSGVDGNVSLALDPLTTIPEGMCVHLEDLETGSIATLGMESLDVALEPSAWYSDRFLLHFYPAPVFEAIPSYCEPGVSWEGSNAEAWNVQWLSIEDGTSGSGNLDDLLPGVYELTATLMGAGCSSVSTVEVLDLTCLGDFDQNEQRGTSDLLILLASINAYSDAFSPWQTVSTDCDCDGITGTQDLLLFLPVFGVDCD